jgi:hypothetical protein
MPESLPSLPRPSSLSFPTSAMKKSVGVPPSGPPRAGRKIGCRHGPGNRARRREDGEAARARTPGRPHRGCYRAEEDEAGARGKPTARRGPGNRARRREDGEAARARTPGRPHRGRYRAEEDEAGARGKPAARRILVVASGVLSRRREVADEVGRHSCSSG